jgi:hypothetical protein
VNSAVRCSIGAGLRLRAARPAVGCLGGLGYQAKGKGPGAPRGAAARPGAGPGAAALADGLGG